MDRFFNMDNKFFTFMSRVADLIILNLLCIVCCIPVVTIGPSIAAMFYVTLKMVRNEESYIVRGFLNPLTESETGYCDQSDHACGCPFAVL